jgi:hypothetical protein
MTPEQVARIVKVCEKIGWPKSYYFDGHYWLHEFNGLNIDAVVLAEFRLRQWLVGRYDRVLIEYTSDMPFKHRIECGMSGEITARVRVAGNDYLDLLLTAVERTLE